MSFVPAPTLDPPTKHKEACRVIVVDDSAVIRGLLTRWLEEDPDIRVVASAANGVVALRAIKQHPCDVVILDIEMPEMDGLTALPLIREYSSTIQVIMASTLTARNADISLHALSLGAADYIPKPQSTRMVSAGVDFRLELIGKVKALTARARGEKPNVSGFTPPTPVATPPIVAPQRAPLFHAEAAALAKPASLTATPASPAPTTPPPVRMPFSAQSTTAAIPPAHTPVHTPVHTSPPATLLNNPRSGQITLQPLSKVRPDILAIGSSTGGPQALFTLFSALPKTLRVPIIVTQHMPPTFTAILAQHIARLTEFPTKEAQHDDLLKPGHIYIAPGDHHMLVRSEGSNSYLVINQDPPENFCRPAVDPMFRSVAAHFGARALCAILTGMGQDGTRGGRDIIAKGGSIIAQDEATSVVWGMPGAVAQAGLAAKILPLNEIAPAIVELVQGTGK